MAIDPPEQDTTLLDGLLEPFGECLTPEVAQKLVKLRVSSAVITRVEELADKCNEGELTAEERAEYESYVHVNDVMTLLKARAQKFLQAISNGLA